MTPNERNERVLSERAVNDFLQSNYNDLHNTHLWMVNEIIVSLWDYTNERPTVEQVKLNWRFDYGNLHDVTDAEIQNIIYKVSRFYN